MEEQAKEKVEKTGKESGEKPGEEIRDELADNKVIEDNSVLPAKEIAPATKTKAERRAKDDLSLSDMAGSTFLLVILSFLIANCYVAYLGKTYNDRVLRESIALAGQAANEGKDTPHVQLAAYGAWAHCAESGFFVQHPEFVVFKDEIKPEEDRRTITISSITKVRLPAPYLLLDKTILDQSDEPFSLLTFKNTYQYQLLHPKNVSGHVIKMPDGKVKRMPGKEGPAVAKPGETTPVPDKKARDARPEAAEKPNADSKSKTDSKTK